jgi:flavin-dependent dehydrogenase
MEDCVRLLRDDGQLCARAAVLAHGAAGVLGGVVRPQDGPDASGLCIEHRFPVKTPDPYADLAGLIDIHFGICRFGYGWVFHHGRYYSVGIGGLRSRLRDPIGVFRSFGTMMGFEAGQVRLRGHLIPCGGIPRRVVAPRILLAGDAAGHVDALYGEGIAFAIRSGQLAAETVAGRSGRATCPSDA